MLLDPNGKPISSDKAAEEAQQRVMALLQSLREWATLHLCTPEELLTLGINLSIAYVIHEPPADQSLDAARARALQVMQFNEQAMGKTLETHQINLKVKASLDAQRAEAANGPTIQ